MSQKEVLKTCLEINENSSFSVFIILFHPLVNNACSSLIISRILLGKEYLKTQSSRVFLNINVIFVCFFFVEYIISLLEFFFLSGITKILVTKYHNHIIYIPTYAEIIAFLQKYLMIIGIVRS